jgi:hypothetical protein
MKHTVGGSARARRPSRKYAPRALTFQRSAIIETQPAEGVRSAEESVVSFPLSASLPKRGCARKGAQTLRRRSGEDLRLWMSVVEGYSSWSAKFVWQNACVVSETQAEIKVSDGSAGGQAVWDTTPPTTEPPTLTGTHEEVLLHELDALVRHP